MLFTCIKSWFFRNHLANFHQISHWSFCWNVIDSLFKWLCSLTVRPIYSSSKLRTVQMMIFSLVAMIGLEKCCITSAYLQWLCHLGERAMAHGPLVLVTSPEKNSKTKFCALHKFLKVWNNFIVFDRSIDKDQKRCRVQERPLLLSSLCTYLPWDQNIVQAITPIVFEIIW